MINLISTKITADNTNALIEVDIRGMIYIGADHRGFQLKEDLKKFLKGRGQEAENMGALAYDETDDYVDFAVAVAQKVAENPELNRGILICGSGHGVDIVANKYRSIRAALAFNSQVAAQSREHDDANILVLAADWIKPEEAEDMVAVWLGKEFSGEDRHVRRLGKIANIEKENFK